MMTGNIRVWGTLTLDLNGYVLKRTNHSNYLLGIEGGVGGGTCTLKDSNPNTSHYGIPKTIQFNGYNFDYLWEYDASYTASTPNAIEIKGGIMTGGIGQTGGCVLNRGTFNMQGGTIVGNFVFCHPFKVKEGSPEAWVEKIKYPWKWSGQHDSYTFYHVVSTGCDAATGCYNFMDDGTTSTEGFNNIQGEGGGVWSGCGAVFNMSGGRICYNYAAFHGGGVYCAGEFNMTGGLIDHNYSLGGYGAGVFINRDKQYHPNFENGAVPVGVMTMDGGEISDNTTWGGSGGGIMAWKGKGTTILTINNGTFQNNQSLGNRAPGSLGNGGAVYGEACDMIIKNIEVHGNYSGNYGGGIYLWAEADLAMNQGICNITGNSSKMGGGGLCLRHASCSATLGSGVLIEGNTSVTEHGGGFFMKGISLTINGAKIRNNHAALNGGGVYVDVNTAINILGNTEITGNSADGLGGGVYFENSASMTVGTGAMNIRHNTVAGHPNNIYLLEKDGSDNSKTISIASGATFNPQYVGVYTENRTPNIPVFTGTATQLGTIFNGMVLGTMHIYDDSQQFNPINPNGGTTLYFGSTPWSPMQQTVKKSDDLVDGDNDGYYDIGNVKQLTAFLWYVNGINDHGSDWGSGTQNAKGKLTADINMDSHYWVPIGNGYTGIFDGNGYTISNLTMVSTNVSGERGMFGVNTSGTIKNIILKDCYFASKTSYSDTGYLGAIVSQNNGGTLSNSVAHGTLIATTSDCIVGGVAGANNGTVHSCYAALDMTGYQMGGLVGSNSGNLYNSFANASFDYKGDSKYCGGLVGVNTGRVENCYSRVQATAPSSTYFGYLTGNNTSTSEKGLYFCYAPNATYVATVSGTTAGNRVGLGTYGATSTPYLYNHRDNQVTVTVGSNPFVNNVSGADKQMLIALNNWVTTENTEETPRAVCTYWLRPTTKTINDDLPLLRLPATNAVAAENGSANLDYNQVNDLLLAYTTSTKAICLYGQEGSMSSNSSSAAPLYIDQEATLIPASPVTVINGYTSQMINKYASSRWHNFSSPLQQSDIGFTYHNSEPAPFGWTENPCSVTIADDDAHSLFPSDLLDKTTFASVDLYCFYEPEYHWLNLKRDTYSHWHMNATTEPINYVGNGIGASTNGNETYLVPGKGYLVSIDTDQLLQNYGTLNNGDVPLYSVTKSDYNAWAGRLGFNLLGNPYQSYLDFEKFMDASIGSGTNAGNLWTGSSEYNRTYATFDPKLNSYVQYKSGTSVDANTASQYIHPHQGFFIRMTKGTNSSTTVKYTNAMRSLRGNDKSQFRGGEQPAYPLINFLVRDSEGNADIAVLEFGRTEDDGATKMRMNECKGMISLGYGSDDFGILFRTEVEDYQSLRFEATEEGIFTLTWNTANAEFDKLTLIDNITGTTTDMLGRDSYSFEATPDQYASRFKVVIGDYKGIDEPEEDGPSTGSGTFAFQMGDQLVVNGEGELQIIDMLGRVVMTDQLTGSQSTTNLPKTAGVYVLRLTDTNGTRTQKMVIR